MEEYQIGEADVVAPRFASHEGVLGVLVQVVEEVVLLIPPQRVLLIHKEHLLEMGK